VSWVFSSRFVEIVSLFDEPNATPSWGSDLSYGDTRRTRVCVLVCVGGFMPRPGMPCLVQASSHREVRGDWSRASSPAPPSCHLHF